MLSRDARSLGLPSAIPRDAVTALQGRKAHLLVPEAICKSASGAWYVESTVIAWASTEPFVRRYSLSVLPQTLALLFETQDPKLSESFLSEIRGGTILKDLSRD